MALKYEDEITPLLAQATQLEAEIFADLDEDNGGTRWMHGILDVPRNCLITDYLISSLRGLQSALVGASYELERYHEARTSEDFALKQRLRKAREQNLPETAGLTPQTIEDRTKALRVQLSSEHFTMHLGQALDRSAACVSAVGGFPNDLLTISWTKIADRARNGLPRDRSIRGTQSEQGYDRQAAFLKAIAEVIARHRSAFEWLWQFRHSTLHRSPMINWVVQAQTGKNSFKMVRPFPRQPAWGFHESMVAGERHDMNSLLILRDPGDVLDGLWEILRELMETSIAAMNQLWIERRESPTLILQPVRQWAKIGSGRIFEFDGYGSTLRTSPDSSIHISPNETKRIRAAKLFDTDGDVWSGN